MPSAPPVMPDAPAAPNGWRVVADLTAGWELASTAPGICTDPAAATAAGLGWLRAVVPGTVAMSLGHDVGREGLHDALDWWYRCRFDAPETDMVTSRLRFDGLATLAEVWFNGQRLLSARNMFVPLHAEVGPLLRAHDNELHLCFRSLDAELTRRRPRPRWKTSLVASQNLRWVRTTLLGRMPGWTPPVHPVGPWKPILLETVGAVALSHLDLQTQLDANHSDGRVRLQARLRATGPVSAARLRVAESLSALYVSLPPGRANDTDIELQGEIVLTDVPVWWPHTHGAPLTSACQLEVQIDGTWAVIDCGRIGFRHLRVERADGAVQLQVNGVPIFCRGACWTSDDALALHGDPATLRRTLTLARDAGLNMLRVGGTMTYESDAFYTLCDELGILVWQDFMFANMDYPVDDAAFAAEIHLEADTQLARLQRHPCIAAYCGGSEIEQQAAMLGLPASEWRNVFFGETLPALCQARHAGVPYFSSSPCEGALPFHVATGIAHYYGVGAYRRPLSDVRWAGVKFATECLGFSHVPEPETLDLMMGGTTPPAHHPLWKARQPRDVGSGWDFEDVRDHYLRALFGIDPIALRSHDNARYLALSREATGEVMRRVYAEWRTPRSRCGGALAWFLKDLWPGAGWGVIDSTGRPKAAYWYLRRVWAPRTVALTDEGLDGLHVQVFNDRPEPFQGRVLFTLFQHGRVRVAEASSTVSLAAHGHATLSADALLGRFADTTYAYKFGPPPHDVAVARLMSDEGAVLAEDFHFPLGLDLPMQTGGALSATAQRLDDGGVLLTLSCDTLLQSVHIECAGFYPDDAHFHLAPCTSKTVIYRPLDGATAVRFKAHIGALNLRESLTLRAE